MVRLQDYPHGWQLANDFLPLQKIARHPRKNHAQRKRGTSPNCVSIRRRAVLLQVERC